MNGPPEQMKYRRIFKGATSRFASANMLHAPHGEFDSAAAEELLMVLGFHQEQTDTAERLPGSKLDKADLPKLTARELDVLSWTAQGKTAWEVGVVLGVAEKTVNFHLRNAMRKLEVTSKHQAVLKCVSAGLL